MIRRMRRIRRVREALRWLVLPVVLAWYLVLVGLVELAQLVVWRGKCGCGAKLVERGYPSDGWQRYECPRCEK